ncbi:MAG: hypothetical protein IKN89_13930, partial [Oscillospiraceae bacterium]|nr:hypothetical protein [Oscillospiraceae bacterium]
MGNEGTRPYSPKWFVSPQAAKLADFGETSSPKRSAEAAFWETGELVLIRRKGSYRRKGQYSQISAKRPLQNT